MCQLLWWSQNRHCILPCYHFIFLVKVLEPLITSSDNNHLGSRVICGYYVFGIFYLIYFLSLKMSLSLSLLMFVSIWGLEAYGKSKWRWETFCCCGAWWFGWNGGAIDFHNIKSRVISVPGVIITVCHSLPFNPKFCPHHSRQKTKPSQGTLRRQANFHSH